MKNYTYQNNLIGKKQLRHLLAWSFTNYDSIQACALADELKYLGFKYASKAGISITIEDLKIPFVKNLMLEKANQEIIHSEKIYLKGKITNVERFQKIIDTWSLSSESLKEQVINYFKNYDPLNSVYIMAFSGARGNLSQVRQLVGMRGLMSDPSGQIMNLPIKKNFREGLTITDYLMSGYGARKGIVDTALKTANSGYLTRRLIDVGQDILIREKDCLTTHSFLFSAKKNDSKTLKKIYDKILGRVLNSPIFDPITGELIVHENCEITPSILEKFKKRKIIHFYIRSPLTCNLYRAICQKCYGWDLANENLVDIGEAIGILAGQSIGEPGTQLTMRTFHTGGIFTSKARQQIISPISGVIKFYKILETVPLRTNRGENVLITKNSGSLVIIPQDPFKKLVKIEVLRNTILFPKNNQYILKDNVIGELLDMNKQIKTEIKQITSDTCGEIFIPKLKRKINSNNSNNNKLIWILSGNLYNSPKNSFINFYPDSKLNRNSYIFRTKIINHYSGNIKLINNKLNLYQRLVRINNNKYSLFNSKLRKINILKQSKNCLLTIKDLTYFLRVQQENLKFYVKLSRNQQIGILLDKKFRTLTGGIIYYNYHRIIKCNRINDTLSYINRNDVLTKYNQIVSYRTIVCFGEEFHKVNCESNILLVEHGDFISEGFELIPGLFSKTSGIVIVQQKSSLVQTISIKCGLVYEGKKFKNTTKKLYYPGEVILSNIHIKNLSFCEQIQSKKVEQLLVSSIIIYEFPFSNLSQNRVNNNNTNNNSSLKLHSKSTYSYKSNQLVKGKKNLNLVSHTLNFDSNQFLDSSKKIELIYNKKRNLVDFLITEKVILNNHLLPNLRYKEIQSCLLIQPKQFIDCYTIIGYLESLTLNSLEIVKFKIKIKDTKQVFLISNENCFNINKKEFKTKKLNDFIINSRNVNETGKVIISNKQLLTVQKGKPYFFPNCKDKRIINSTSLKYKILSPDRIQKRSNTRKHIFLNYYDTTKVSIKKLINIKSLKNSNVSLKTEFSKLFLEKNGKLYSSLIPQFLKKFTIGQHNRNLKYKQILQPTSSYESNNIKLNRTLLLQSSELTKNDYKVSKELDHQLVLIKFLEQPFTKTTKSIGLYSITEDYFEQDVNTVFWKNSEFIEEGETIGLLNLEKEITGDIVQGLPRIEEILEARKKNSNIKRMPTSKKKGLIIQKTNLDPNFEFRKLGTSMKDNEKINPHKLLKVYFNYYGLRKFFTCDRTKTIKYNRLIQNDEGSYKSFKKVQIFILNSVQSVYKSQGVTINDKHLEVIIKQMTTKVLITHEGNTPLLRREVVDLYHIQYINKIVKIQKKQSACYIPLLLGITKAALNNPSFISAASFQETTRVLTKAAIEGGIDWLRGLKENIIIGHLIPAGTGSQTYRNCFKKRLDFDINFKESFFDISKLSQKTGQVK